MKLGIASRRPDVASAIRGALSDVPGMRIEWLSSDLGVALDRVEVEPVDVVLLDPELASTSASGTTRALLRSAGAVLLVVRDGADCVGPTCEAMLSGALDVLTLDTAGNDSHALIARVAAIGKLVVEPPGSLRNGRPPLVALAASTGGPPALARVLRELPTNFAVVVVQHLDAEFASSLARTLSEQSDFSVDLVGKASRPTAGVVHLAGRDEHLVMTKSGCFCYTRAPGSAAHRPSADVLFSSLAAHWSSPGAAAVLTGMGSDGAAGLLELRRAAWFTIVQDEASCAVYGMPKAALKLGAANSAEPPAAIGRSIARYLSPAAHDARA